VYFIYNRNKAVLKKYKKSFIRKLYIQRENNKEKKVNFIEKREINKDILNKINNLDENFYYNKKLEKYSIDLYYI
jgi:hypothetical protein